MFLRSHAIQPTTPPSAIDGGQAEERKRTAEDDDAKEVPEELTEPTTKKAELVLLRCELCGVSCAGEERYQVHVEGRKHRKKARRAAAAAATKSSEVNGAADSGEGALNASNDVETAGSVDDAASTKGDAPEGVRTDAEADVEEDWAKAHITMGIWHCTLCDATINHNSLPYDHIAKKAHQQQAMKRHGVPKFHCATCDETCPNRRTYMEHLKRDDHRDAVDAVLESRTFDCRICNISFINEESLRLHEERSANHRERTLAQNAEAGDKGDNALPSQPLGDALKQGEPSQNVDKEQPPPPDAFPSQSMEAHVDQRGRFKASTTPAEDGSDTEGKEIHEFDQDEPTLADSLEDTSSSERKRKAEKGEEQEKQMEKAKKTHFVLLRCELCDATCHSEVHFQGHLGGKRHRNNVAAAVLKSNDAIVTATSEEGTSSTQVDVGCDNTEQSGGPAAHPCKATNDAARIDTSTTMNEAMNEGARGREDTGTQPVLAMGKERADILKPLKSDASSKAQPPIPAEKEKKTERVHWYCNLCEVMADGQELPYTHLIGKKHQKKVQKLRGIPMYHCPMCDKTSNSAKAYRAHLKMKRKCHFDVVTADFTRTSKEFRREMSGEPVTGACQMGGSALKMEESSVAKPDHLFILPNEAPKETEQKEVEHDVSMKPGATEEQLDASERSLDAEDVGSKASTTPREDRSDTEGKEIYDFDQDEPTSADSLEDASSSERKQNAEKGEEPEAQMEKAKKTSFALLRCELCNATCQSEIHFQAHLNGKRHRANAALLARKRMHCSICNTGRDSEVDHNAHTHQKTVRILTTALLAGQGHFQIALAQLHKKQKRLPSTQRSLTYPSESPAVANADISSIGGKKSEPELTTPAWFICREALPIAAPIRPEPALSQAADVDAGVGEMEGDDLVPPSDTPVDTNINISAWMASQKHTTIQDEPRSKGIGATAFVALPSTGRGRGAHVNKPAWLTRREAVDAVGLGVGSASDSSGSSSGSESSEDRKRTRKKKKRKRSRDDDDDSHHRKRSKSRSSRSKHRKRNDRDDRKRKKRKDKSSHRRRDDSYSSSSDEEGRGRSSKKRRRKGSERRKPATTCSSSSSSDEEGRGHSSKTRRRKGSERRKPATTCTGSVVECRDDSAPSRERQQNGNTERGGTPARKAPPNEMHEVRSMSAANATDDSIKAGVRESRKRGEGGESDDLTLHEAGHWKAKIESLCSKIAAVDQALRDRGLG